jgi:NAD(P)-dependent dehydrogenase (short-subunit alcohol dehydrogenase family)
MKSMPEPKTSLLVTGQPSPGLSRGLIFASGTSSASFHTELWSSESLIDRHAGGVALSRRFPYLKAADLVEVEDRQTRSPSAATRGLICEECGVHGGNYKPATKYAEEDMSEFDGLVGIVTGGASGIGAAIAARLCRAGAGVAVVDRNLAQRSDEIFALQADVTDDTSVRTAVDAVLARFGRLDVVVNNAGIGAQGTVADNTDEEWLHVFDVNVVGIVRMTRAALPALRRSPSGAIVNTCSIAATAGLPQRALYSATKGAVLALTRAMAADHIAEGIRVNCVNPGTTDTPWVSGLLAGAADPRAERAALNARQPHGRLVSVEEVADAVAYLASPAARSTTGISLAVDGGMQELRLRN